MPFRLEEPFREDEFFVVYVSDALPHSLAFSMAEIILISGPRSAENPENLRLIRSHAMRHVRQRQRGGRDGQDLDIGDNPIRAGKRSACFGILRLSALSSGQYTQNRTEEARGNTTQENDVIAEDGQRKARLHGKILHFHSTNAYRSFLTEEFLSSCFPRSESELSIVRAKLHQWSLSDPIAVAAVMDGFLFKLSWLHDDDRFLLAA